MSVRAVVHRGSDEHIAVPSRAVRSARTRDRTSVFVLLCDFMYAGERGV